MHDLSARAKFNNAHFQSPILIMSKIVAEISLLTEKWKKCSELIFFFFNSDDDRKFWWGHFRNIKQSRLVVCLH